MRSALLLLLSAVLVFGQAVERLAREGDQWVRTESRTLEAPSEGLLRAAAPCAIEVRGSAREGIRYSFKTSIRTWAEADARRLLSGAAVRARSEGGWLSLAVVPPPRDRVSCELRLEVPRGLREVALAARADAVSAAGLDGSVDLETGAGEIKLDRIGGDVAVRTGGGQVTAGRIGGSFRCLSGGGPIRGGYIGGSASFESAGGEITIAEVRGPVQASTAGGNIRIERAGSTVSANTGGGLINVLSAGGVVQAQSASGYINVSDATGARIEAAAGAIHLRGIAGPFRASTGAGNILAELLAGQKLGDSILYSGGGDVTVAIPSNVAVTLKILMQSADGKSAIISDFPDLRRVSDSLLEGSLNGGGPVLQISATGGRIYIRRRK